MVESFIDSQKNEIIICTDGYVYAVPLFGDWILKVRILMNGGERASLYGVECIGTSDQFLDIKQKRKR